MTSEQTANPNITSDYKVSLFLGSDLESSFYASYQRFRELHPYHSSRDHLAVEYEGYAFYLCSQSNHLNWIGQANNLAQAELVEHFAQQLLLELGYYPAEVDDDIEISDPECRSEPTSSMGM